MGRCDHNVRLWSITYVTTMTWHTDHQCDVWYFQTLPTLKDVMFHIHVLRPLTQINRWEQLFYQTLLSNIEVFTVMLALACQCPNNLSCWQQTRDMAGWCLSSPNPFFVRLHICTGDGDDLPQPNKIRTSGRLRMEVWLWCGQPTGTRNLLVMKMPGQKSPHLHSLWWWWLGQKQASNSTFMFRNYD